MPHCLPKIKSLVLLLAAILAGCDPPVQETRIEEPDPVPEAFIRTNQYMQRRHQDHIAAFVERVGWDAMVTASGLWVVIEKPGTGKKIESGSIVTYAFNSTLLDGTPCYEASEERPKRITAGRGGVESGVEEGLLRMREGTEAILIIPPHLGHGNFGDRDRIPGNSVLIYHVKVLEVQ